MYQQVIIVKAQSDIESQIRDRFPSVLNINRLFIANSFIIEQEFVGERELQNGIWLTVWKQWIKCSWVRDRELKILTYRKTCDFKTGFQAVFCRLVRDRCYQ